MIIILTLIIFVLFFLTFFLGMWVYDSLFIEKEVCYCDLCEDKERFIGRDRKKELNTLVNNLGGDLK